MPDPYFSELKYLGGPTDDFIEITVDAGYDVSNLVVTIYNDNGTIRTTNAVSGLTHTTVAGKDIYIIESGSPSSFNGLGKSNGLSLSEGSTVYTFNSFDDTATEITATEGPADGMTSVDVGIAGSGSSLESDDGGATYTVQTNPTPGSIPCLTAGTMIMTDKGLVAVEDLTEGALVTTLDGTVRPIMTPMHTEISARDMAENPKLRPIRICAGALGNGLPTRDLLVSRQHRMLVSSPIVERMFGTTEVLVAAIKLVGTPGIFVDTTVTSVQYFHLIFERHEVIFAEGAPTESLLLGDETLKILPDHVLEEYASIFPSVIGPAAVVPVARVIPSAKRQTRLATRHADNSRMLLENFAA